MKATFYNFSKKNNSTAIPSGGSEIDIFLKDNCSVLNPVIELHSDTRPLYTYCHIPDFTRYYFIGDWNYDRGVWTASLSIDVGASYRAQIREYTAFVERSASNYDININDNLLSSKQNLTNVSYRNEVAGFDLNGCYIIRVTGSASTIAPTGVYLYALTKDQLGSLLSYLYNSNNFADILAEEFVKAVFNPLDYIISIKWFPFNPSSLAGASVSMTVGWWDTGITGKLLANTGGNIELRVEPMTRYYNDWRDLNPNFTKYSLYIPTYGVVDIPPEEMHYNNGFKLEATVDFYTGQFAVFLDIGSDENGGSGNTYVGAIGFDVQVGQLVANIGNVVSGVSSAVGGVMSGNFGGLLDVAKSVVSPQARTLGSAGAKQGFSYKPWFTLTRKVTESAEYPTTVAGRPLMQNVKLGALSGFTKCGNASISLSAYTAERDAVNSMLNEGIYIE